MGFRSDRRSRPEKEGAENWEEDKVDEESDMDGDKEEAGVEELTLDRFSDFSQSIAAGARIHNKSTRLIIYRFFIYDTSFYIIIAHKY